MKRTEVDAYLENVKSFMKRVMPVEYYKEARFFRFYDKIHETYYISIDFNIMEQPTLIYNCEDERFTEELNTLLSKIDKERKFLLEANSISFKNAQEAVSFSNIGDGITKQMAVNLIYRDILCVESGEKCEHSYETERFLL